MNNKFDTNNMKINIFARKKAAPLDEESMHQLILMFDRIGDYSLEVDSDLDVYVNFPNFYLTAEQVQDLKELTHFSGCKIASFTTGMLLIRTVAGKFITVRFNGSFLNGAFMTDVAAIDNENTTTNNNKTGKDEDSDDEGNFSLTQEINF